MTRKRPFKFDFNEDADPVEELHRLRVATAKHFKTLDAIMDYCSTQPTPKEVLAELNAEIAAKKAKAARPQQAKPTAKPTRCRGAVKRPVHV